MSNASAKKIVENPVLNEGDKAPDFTLPKDGGGQVSLKNFTGKQHVVLYFYPKDDTPGCTTEAKDFRDLKAEFDAANVAIIGVSKDSVARHDKFKTKYALNFDLGSDETGAMLESYGVWVEKSMYGKKYMGIQRATFLIHKDGSIAKIWPKVSVTNHAKEVLKAARSL